MMHRCLQAMHRQFRSQPELPVLLLLLLLVNASLLHGAAPQPWILFMGEFPGQWWRFLTHPLAHTSIYHLLLDAGAFLSLYIALKGRLWQRLELLAVSAGGSLAAALLTTPELGRIGFCGLSGVGHGLMAAIALQLCGSNLRPTRRIGALTLALTVLKAGIEAVTGSVVLAGLHAGDVGVPIAACHAGGLLGGVLWAVHMQLSRAIRVSAPTRLQTDACVDYPALSH